MKIIQQRERKEGIEYTLSYAWDINNPHSGFAFTCDKDGNVSDDMPQAAKENLAKCKANAFSKPIHFVGILTRGWSYVEPRIGLCDCGQEVILDHFTNTCECGRDYNSSGQELAPRSQWGEDTQEHLSDILRIK
jgi:hypothetical protein